MFRFKISDFMKAHYFQIHIFTKKYEIIRNPNPKSNKLDKYLDNLFTNEYSKINLTKNEILILASIIEKEAGNNDEKKLIASVFLKRLDLGMKLQADPTIIYGLLPNFDGDIKKSDILDSNNKFNTYMIKGLPPTPISISSPSSIDAAVNSFAR